MWSVCVAAAGELVCTGPVVLMQRDDADDELLSSILIFQLHQNLQTINRSNHPNTSHFSSELNNFNLAIRAGDTRGCRGYAVQRLRVCAALFREDS